MIKKTQIVFNNIVLEFKSIFQFFLQSVKRYLITKLLRQRQLVCAHWSFLRLVCAQKDNSFTQLDFRIKQ